MYVSPGNGSAVRMNANLLLVHAVAARRRPRRRGAPGRARAGAARDAHARAVVRARGRRGHVGPHALRVLDARPRLAPARPPVLGPAGHRGARAGLARAARARRARALAARVAGAIDRCARRPAWRFPHGVANQFNWNAQLYADAAAVTGRRDLLRGDYRRFVHRFAQNARRPAARHGGRQPRTGLRVPLLARPAARRTAQLRHARSTRTSSSAACAGTRAPCGRACARCRPPTGGCCARGSRALLAGAWTHAGYLNWDTGYGAGRWHSGQYWAFAQQGLLADRGRARSCGRAAPTAAGRRRCSTAACCSTTAGRARPGRRSRRGWSSASSPGTSTTTSTRRAWPRTPCGPSRRAWARCRPRTRRRSTRSTRTRERLAVTTPRYSTAIVPDNRGAFDYGGIDLARLYGPGQRVAGHDRRRAAGRVRADRPRRRRARGARDPARARAARAPAHPRLAARPGTSTRRRTRRRRRPARSSGSSRAAACGAAACASSRATCSGATGSTPPGASPARGAAARGTSSSTSRPGARARRSPSCAATARGSASPARGRPGRRRGPARRAPHRAGRARRRRLHGDARGRHRPGRPRGDRRGGAAHRARPGADARAAPARRGHGARARARRCGSHRASESGYAGVPALRRITLGNAVPSVDDPSPAVRRRAARGRRPRRLWKRRRARAAGATERRSVRAARRPRA